MARVVVTGGAGFLGSHVVRRLHRQDDQVAVVDDLSSGSIANLGDLGMDDVCTIGDLKDYEFARWALKGADTVFHFAAEVGSVAYLHGSEARELAALQANLAIDVNVFRACLENGVRSIIFASSVSVYPIDEQMGSSSKFSEEDSERKVNPEGGYGWAKYVAEKQLELMPDVRVGVARIFHAYGQNIYLKPDRSQVIGSLIRKATTYPGEGFVVWGDGSQRRSFVFVDDAIDALFRLRDYVEQKGSLTVNVGSTQEVTVRELAQRVIALSGKDIPLEFDIEKPTGALNRMPDLQRVKRELGWSPTTDFNEGLERTYAWAVTRLSRGQ